MRNIDILETPCYVLDYDELEYNYNSMEQAFLKHWGKNHAIGYSVKTNNLPWILEYMLKKGAYAEVVSSSEYELSKKLGFKSSEIIYNGPVKDFEILREDLNHGVIVNVDNTNSLTKIKDMNLRSPKILIRLNFDFESQCTEELSLGNWPSRFGISLEDGSFKKAIDYCKENGIKVVGLHVHQSLKKRSVKAFEVIARTITQTILKYDLLEDIEYVDVGGGFFGGRGVENRPSFDEYAKVIARELKVLLDSDKVKLLIEPGASLISSPISYYTRVISVKDIRGSRVVIVDGTNLHINPFDIKRTPPHTIFSSGKNYSKTQLVSGSTCLEDDRLLEIENEMELEVGDIIEIKRCGGYTMSLNNCFINMPPVVYLKRSGEYEEIRKTWTIDKLF